MNRVEEALKAADETKALEIGANAIQRVAQVFKSQFPGKKARLVADSNTYKVAGKEVELILTQEGVIQSEPYIFTDPKLYAEYRFVEELEKVLIADDAIPVVVGSGTLNDITKLASFRTNRRYMCVATAASMDGYTAYGASITFEGAKQTFNCPAPQAVVADTVIVGAAPALMTASGYADLFAKITAGADWILADAMGVEAVEQFAWSVVQDGLKDALADPEGARRGEAEAILPLIEGLMLGGFAMQATRSSRPASGAEHQFSHLWDMEHHTYQGKAPSHGFKVAIGMLAVVAFYEQLLATPFEQLDVDFCCSEWPEKEEVERIAAIQFEGSDFPTIGVVECGAKHITKEELAVQLGLLKQNWLIIAERLRQQLPDHQEVKRRLALVGAPTEPEEIGISRSRLRESFIKAQMIRRRFTILDVAVRTHMMDTWLDGLFGKGGIWEIN